MRFSLRDPTQLPGACLARPQNVCTTTILTTIEEFDLWLGGETVEALKLQRPLPDGMLGIVAWPAFA
jgi:hypothetical protein